MLKEPLQGWDESELVMISALQHYVYCPRQCALIHVEGIYEENLYTLQGSDIHERVDEKAIHQQGSMTYQTSVPIWSERLGIHGRADLVEFRADGPYPIEYKRGSKQHRQADEVQLCAQTLCLEEMLGVKILQGAIYHYKSRRRREVLLDDTLRAFTEETIKVVRQMLSIHDVPPPANDARCPRCSLRESCMPQILDNHVRLTRYQHAVFDPRWGED